ncbi:NAD(P)-dependent oxidoreductase [Rhizobium sp. LjRoot98]|uniref:NAD-dependent epimerase/dehydratase family protein n=1 Tax=Rhizobium sp. LjRoot98 TaxID=3342345 RepID=UPI003ECDF192
MSDATIDPDRPFVLVTGAAGLVGAAATVALRAAGYEVIATDRLVPEGGEALDFTDVGAVETFASRKLWAIVHCGAISGPADAKANPQLIAPVNVLGTFNLLELARKCKVEKFVYCSSTSVYGNIDTHGPVGEELPLKPQSLYGASKASAEALVLGYCQEFGFDAVCLRISTVYGPDRKHYCAIRRLVDDAIQGNVGVLEHGLHDFRQYVHVSDAASAIVLALNATETSRFTYNVTGGEGDTVGGIVSLIATYIPGFTASIGAQRDPGEDIHPLFSIAAAKRDLGYCPKVSLAHGIRDLIETVKANNLQGVQKNAKDY